MDSHSDLLRLSRPRSSARGAAAAAATLVAEAPGCELWLVHRDQRDPDLVRVSEIWASSMQCDAALDLPSVREPATKVMRLLSNPPELVDSRALGGARMIRGKTGSGQATRRLETSPAHPGSRRRSRVVLRGSARITVDDDAFALQPLDAVRVAPGSAREFEAGSAGLEVLAFGSHIPGDRELVSERPTHE